MPKTQRYIEKECEEESMDTLGQQLLDEDEYEKDSFIASSDDEEKSCKLAKTFSTTVKVFSNKTLDITKVPPKPKVLNKDVNKKQYDFRLTFTNGSMLTKFFGPLKCVQKVRIKICVQEKLQDPNQTFTGFRVECHDQAFTLACRGMFECDVESNMKHLIDGQQDANGLDFCISSEALMEALVASTQKETDLSITRYMDHPDRITFESINNDGDVRAVYNCNLVDSSQVEALEGMCFELQFHVNVSMSTLKELSLNAKRCGAPTLCFELFQAIDTTDPSIMHSKMRIGFTGTNTSGNHDFFISTRKEKLNGAVKWVPLSSSVSMDILEGLQMERKSKNYYDNKKLRLFLNHMECTWVLVHLCTDNSAQALVLDCVLGGSKTKHTVIIAPRSVDEFGN